MMSGEDMTHTYLDETIMYDLLYKKRKTMGIYIDGYGHIELRIPKETPDERINQLIEEKWDWIQKSIKETKDRMAGQKERVYSNGEVFQYLGCNYPAEIVQDINSKQDHVAVEGDKLVIYVMQNEDERIKQALKRFYYQRCKALVEDRIRYYQSSFKLKTAVNQNL